jgi:hypothetical protein
MHADVAWPHIAAEPVSEPVVRTVAESESNDDLYEVELDQDPPGARNQDLAPLSTPASRTIARRMPASLKGRVRFAKTSYLCVGS